MLIRLDPHLRHDLIATALGLVLAAPAMAQVSVGAKAQGTVATPPPASQPTQAAERATHAVEQHADQVQQRNAARTEATTQGQAQTQATTQGTQTMPPTAQATENAAATSSVAQQDIWGRLDADRDGRISPVEADKDSAFGLDFDDMDTDDDGFVSEAEYRGFARADASQGAEHAAAHSAVATRDVFGRLDADGDGRVSSTEADADTGFDAGFSAMDSNADGFITDAEYRAHAKANAQPRTPQQP